MHRSVLLAASAAALMAGAGPALARPASTGPYAEASLGGVRFIGTESNDAATGLASGIRFGLDLFSWFSVGARVGLSTHEATVPAPPVGEYFQVYHAAAEARLALRLEWLELFVDGSVGGAMMSTNILEKVDVLDPGEKYASYVSAGGGLEYQLQNRHYAFGLGGEWAMMPGFARAQTVGGRAYLRYTY